MGSRAIGFDPGTGFFQVAEKIDNEINIKTIRNAFVELEGFDGIEEILKQNKWQYIKDEKKYFVLGEHSMTVSKIFPSNTILRRPMESGVLNKGEKKKMVVIAQMIEKLIGKAPDEDSVVCFCVSADPVDDTSIDNVFHQARLEGMLKRLGWNTKIIIEGHAVVLAECPVLIEPDGSESKFSGLCVSLGAGRSNSVLAYKALPVIAISTMKCGDWIDKKVSDQTDTPISIVTAKKEKELDFSNISYDDDVIFALDAYYSSAISYIFNNIARKFSEVQSRFEGPIEIIIAGGSSAPKGFIDKVSSVIQSQDLPFQIASIKVSKDPCNSVVKGCLMQAIITQKRLAKEKKS